MTLKIANCPRCGKVFTPGIHDICAACVKQNEQEYELCNQYLRDHRGSTIYELSEGTGVTVRQITKFIREGRISIMDMPNMSYPCESCGALIRKGSVCTDCRNRIQQGVKKIMESDDRTITRSSEGKLSYNIKQNEKWKN